MRVTLTLRQFLVYDATNNVRATFEIKLTRHTLSVGGQISSAGIGTPYGLDGQADTGADEIFNARPERPWGPKLLPIQRVLDLFPGGKLVGLWR